MSRAPDVAPTLDLPHPRVFHDRDELALARANVAPDGPDWARDVRDRVVGAAEATAPFGRDPAAVRDPVPDPGAYVLQDSYALPCPIDRTPLEPVGWDAPGELVCEEGHAVPHPDRDGTTYGDERLQRLFVPYAERHAVAGRIPNYGDSGPLPDTAIHGADPREHDAPDRKELSELLVPGGSLADEAFLWGLTVFVNADDPPADLAAYLTRLAGGDPADALAGVWPVFNVERAPDLVEEPGGDRRPSELLGGQGTVYLRPGTGRTLPTGAPAVGAGDDPGPDVGTPDDTDGEGGTSLEAARGAMLRYGATLNHGHYDELGVTLYAAGREASLDPGYGSAHYRYGWCKHPVAHLTVAIDEATVGPGRLPGGRVNAFGRGAGVSVVDASDPGAYPDRDLDSYRRTFATVDCPGGDGYFVDLFRVDGGRIRDYSFHAAGTAFGTDLAPELGPPAAGSLAGEDRDWGAAVDGDGNARGTGLVAGYEDEGFGFAPPPGTGYGFLGNPRSGTADGTWRATWTDDRDPTARTRLTVLPPATGERTVVVADGPTPMADALDGDGADGDGTDRLPYVLARETGDAASQFAAVIESGTDLPLEEVERLAARSVPADAVLARGDLVDVGRSDDGAGVLEREVRFPFGRSHVMGYLSDGSPTRYYDGKRLVTADGTAETAVTALREDFRTVEVADATGFEPGDPAVRVDDD